MKIKTVIWAVSCVALWSSAQAAFFNFHPATLEEGRALITSDDAHIKRLTKSDLEMRFPGKSPDVKYYKKFAAEQVRAFSLQKSRGTVPIGDKKGVLWLKSIIAQSAGVKLRWRISM